jgi:formylglycine-generating enzyme required for sulfatase activity
MSDLDRETGTVRWLRFLAALFALALGLDGVGDVRADERLALVIGNSHYKNVVPLPNPKNDAEAVGEALTRVGFSVRVAIDLDQLGLLAAFRSFGLQAESADVAVVFYAGHGIQVANENYLLPVDATLARERDLLYEALPLSIVMDEVAQAKRLGLVILDSCRDNPLAEQLRRALGPVRSRLVGTGLARVENMPGNTMVAFSTKPGELAVDGVGEHSPYTAALLEHIEEPGVELNLLFRKVRDSVLEATAYRQEPRTFDSLGAEPFYFKEPKPNQRPELPPLTPLELLDDAGPTPLAIGAPTDADGDALTAQVLGLPQRGRVQVADRTLLIGDVLTMEQLAAVEYAPERGALGDAGGFEFLVKDDRGGTAVGRLPITIERSNQPPAVETAQFFRLPPIPLSIEKPVDPEGDPLTVTVLEVPVRGAIRSGNRVIQPGDEITPDELANLVLEPGAEGASGAFGFKVADPYGASAASSMRFNIPGLGAGPKASPPASPSGAANSSAAAKPSAEASLPAETRPPATTTTTLAAPASGGEPEAAMPAETRATRPQESLSRAEPISPEDQAIVGEYETVRESNIRRGAGTDTERVTTLSEGATLHVIGTVAGRNWFRVRTEDGTEGFIYGPLIRPKPAPASAEPELEPAPEVDQAALPVARVLGSVIKDCPTCPELVSIPAGTFRMGSDEGHWSERPVHRVAVGTPFALSKYEVTVGEWQACLDFGACSSPPEMDEVHDSTPVHNVSWQDAQDYIAWLRQITGQPYRLPTEAEWEYAARAGSTTRYSWGDLVGVGKADCQDCGGDWDRRKPSDVGAFPPNPFGLYDMNGGVMEWVADCWIQDYRTAPGDASARVEPNCMQRTLRGGSWRNDQSYATATSRLGYDAGVRYYTNGFRVARDLN